MNAMTILLSVTASLLAAALILFWQNDNSAAQEEPAILKDKISLLESEVSSLRGDLAQAHVSDQTGASPYATGLTGQAEMARDRKSLEMKELELAKTQDQLNYVSGGTAEAETAPALDDKNLANEEFSSSALANANNEDTSNLSEKQFVDGVQSDLSSTTENSDEITKSKQLQRISEIRQSRVQAIVNYVDRSPDGDIILATIQPNIYLNEGSVLAVRRNTGIAGKVAIVRIQNYGAKGDVATIQPTTAGFGNAPLTLSEGDELILPPLWQKSN